MIINCENLIIAPGLVDLRTQIREPGQEHQDTIKSVSKSADKKNIVEELKGLKDLLDGGAITQDEFEKAKKKVLN